VSPVHVLYLINTWVVGGTETQLLSLLRRMDRGRFHPHVCALYPDPRLAGAMAPLKVPTLSLGIDRVRSPATPARLLRLVSYCRANDVRVIQGLRTDALTALVARAAKVPVALGAQRNTRMLRLDGLARAFRHGMDRLLTGVIANSCAAADYRHALTGFPRARIYTIANGLDLASFDAFAALSRADLLPKVSPAAPLLLILGRLELAMKGHAVLLEALASPALADAHLAVVGDGPDRPLLEALIERKRLRGRVHLLGHRSDAPALLPGADLVVVPSLDNESSPNVVLEAWAARRPVLASRIAGLPELLRDDEHGLLVPPGDAEALAAAARALLDDPVRRRALGACGRRAVEERYSADVMAAATVALYERLLAAPSRRPISARAA
jgi:glycosyltransferase involved in cell wall biosynthesis